jgi:hypothetical protein
VDSCSAGRFRLSNTHPCNDPIFARHPHNDGHMSFILTDTFNMCHPSYESMSCMQLKHKRDQALGVLHILAVGRTKRLT